MARLLDSNLWIDLTRRRSPQSLKDFIAPYIVDSQACLAEPIIFEVLRCATDPETVELTEYFQSLPILDSPGDLWSRGVDLGRACQRVGLSAGSMDILIAVVAIHHGAELLTFDSDFAKMSSVSKLRVTLLKRPAK